jgi:hypothetical protein
VPPLDRSWRAGVRGPSYLLFLLSLQIHGQQQEFPPFPLILCAVSNDLYVFWPFVLLIQLLLLLLLLPLLLPLSSIRLPLRNQSETSAPDLVSSFLVPDLTTEQLKTTRPYIQHLSSLGRSALEHHLWAGMSNAAPIDQIQHAQFDFDPSADC